MPCKNVSWRQLGNLLIAAHHSFLSSVSVLISEGTAQRFVPLESIKKGCMWSTSGSLTMRRFPEDELTCSEFWVLLSKSHPSPTYLVWQSDCVIMTLYCISYQCSSARLQYLHCLCTGDTAVLHWYILSPIHTHIWCRPIYSATNIANRRANRTVPKTMAVVLSARVQKKMSQQGPLSLQWLNFNPSMDK